MARITQADLEAAIGPRRLAACTDDDNDGVADASVVAAVIAEAAGLIDPEIQAGGCPLPVPADLVSPALRAQEAWVACHLAARRKEDWRDPEGRAPYHVEYREAMAWFRRYGASLTRLAAAGEAPAVALEVRADAARGW